MHVVLESVKSRLGTPWVRTFTLGPKVTSVFTLYLKVSELLELSLILPKFTAPCCASTIRWLPWSAVWTFLGVSTATPDEYPRPLAGTVICTPAKVTL
jgi:hypothetical protein